MITLDPKVAFGLAAISLAFHEALNETVQGLDYTKIATELPTTTEKVKLPFLTGRPKMHQRNPSARMDEQNLLPSSYEVENKEWYADVAIEKKVLKNDGAGVYITTVQDIADAIPRHKERVVFSMLTKNQAIGHDGQPYFSATHAIEDENGNEVDVSNLVDEDLTKDNLNEAISTVSGFRDMNGERFGARPTLLVVGDALGPAAWELLNLSPSGAESKTYSGTVIKDLVVSSDVGPSDWFVLDVSRRLKPILVPYRTDVPVESYDDRDDAAARRKGEFHFTVEADYGFGVGAWQLGLGSIRD